MVAFKLFAFFLIMLKSGGKTSEVDILHSIETASQIQLVK